MLSKIRKGDLVKMSEQCKSDLIDNGCEDHVKEFGQCIGVVAGPVNWNRDGEKDPDKFGPEVDVNWMPSNLRYAYDPERDLIKVTKDINNFL